MPSPNRSALLAVIVISFGAALSGQTFGRPATADEIKLWDIDVRPDGKGLPIGRGSVEAGKKIYEAKCLSCSGQDGIGGRRLTPATRVPDRLAGGIGSLATDPPSGRWGASGPTRRPSLAIFVAPCRNSAPGSLSPDDTYALVAYLLNLNGIVPATRVLDPESLTAIKMPNREGFIPDREFVKIKTSK